MIKINKEKCIGCGACAGICSEVFELDSSNKAKVKDGQEQAKKPCVEEAEKACPSQAIKSE